MILTDLQALPVVVDCLNEREENQIDSFIVVYCNMEEWSKFLIGTVFFVFASLYEVI